MFWRMTGLSTASPVETILDKEEYTLEELLDEDEIIQECKALNSRLINFLRETTQVEQLLRYIVEEAPEDAEKRRTFKFPYIACEVFTCEIDVILRTLVENEELMDLLFSFVKPDYPHGTLLAGYFSKVVICLMLRKTAPFMNFIKGHQEIIHQLVDLIGITSIMEVLIRLIGADEHMYSNCMDSTPWLEDMNVLEMIVDKFSSSDSPEVHANAAEVLCAITRYAPPVLAAKISSPSFVGRLFRHALEESRPKSVLVHSLTICISLLDPKRLVSAAYYSFHSSPSGSSVTANPETVDGMLQSLGDLLKILDTSPDTILPTTYGALRPPLGKHRLKIVEFISVLLTIGSEPAEKELIRLGAVRQILDLFFQYPFNNFLHHHVENITVSCLESKQSLLVEHILRDCDLVGKILSAEKNSTLTTADDKPTVAAENKSPPKIGNIGHITRIANKLIQLGNTNSVIQTHLQANSEWVEWLTTALLNRNTMENINQWACGRPSSILDRTRDSDDEDLRDRDYDIPTPDVYFGGDSPEVVISSLCLGDEQDSSSLITNSNWFAFEGNRFVNEESTCSFASPSPSGDDTDDVVLDGSDNSLDKGTSCQVPDAIDDSEEPECESLVNGPTEAKTESMVFSTISDFEKPHEWVEWRETSDKSAQPDSQLTTAIPNGDIERDADPLVHDKAERDVPLQSSSIPEDNANKGEKLAESSNEEPGCSPGSSDVLPKSFDLVKTSNPNDGGAQTIAAEPGALSSEEKTEDKKVDKEAEEKN